MKNNQNTWRVCAIALTFLISLGCGEEPAATTRVDSNSQSDPLYQWDQTLLWPNGIVPVCWTPASTMRADFPTRSAQVRRLVDENWARVANIRFTGWGTCPSNPVGTVAISLNDSGNADSGGFGYTTGLRTMNLGVNRGDFEAVVLHEFGHELGFIHEMTRHDFTDVPNTDCQEQNFNGNAWGTPADRESIMASTYCQANARLSPWDIVGVQNAYGRKAPGSIVGLENKCLDIPWGNPAPGTALQVFSCHGGNPQLWRRGPSNQLFASSFSNAYIDVRGSNSADGTQVQLAYANSPVTANQQFAFDRVRIKAIGGKCLDVPWSSYYNGQRVSIYECHNGANQQWTVEPDGRIRNGSWCLDVPNGRAVDGTVLQLYTCNGGFAQRFSFTSRGEIRFGDKCVDVVGGAPNNGAQLQLNSCKSDADTSKMNQRFHLNGEIRSLGKCLDIRGGTPVNGSAAQIYTCHGGANQQWDYYFNP